MERRVIIAVTALVIAVLFAHSAAAAPNCVNRLTKGSARDWVCTIQSDFASGPFQDCISFFKVSRDRFYMNVLGVSPSFAPGACNSEGSLKNPRFGRSENWMAQYGPMTSTLTIAFTGFDKREGAKFYGRAVNEFGDRFYYRCQPDAKGVCPVFAGPTLEDGQSPWVNPKHQ